MPTAFDREKAANMMERAYESSPLQAKKLATKAMKVDPDNADAYVMLGDMERDLKKASRWYEQGMQAGKRSIGDANFEELKGVFWMAHETRPYMRAKSNYIQGLLALGRQEEAAEQYAEMLALCPSDNLGMRYGYAVLLVQTDQFAAYEKLLAQYEEQSTMWLYTYAAYLFKKEGNSPASQQAILNAYRENPHVIAIFGGELEPPDEAPDHYSPGQPNEAVMYLNDAVELWADTDGLVFWSIAVRNQAREDGEID